MTITIVQSQWKGFRVDSLPVSHVLDIQPEPEYEHGREAKALSDLWISIRDTDVSGLLLLGCDVAADPDDYMAIAKAVQYHPQRVLTGMVKLWPASTGRNEWIWSHRGGIYGAPEAGQHSVEYPAYFSLGFLWVPRQLLDLAFPEHDDWRWGQMDVGLSEIALHSRIVAQAVTDCRPKHLHFTKTHNR
jgi:hypothetical protein